MEILLASAKLVPVRIVEPQARTMRQLVVQGTQQGRPPEETAVRRLFLENHLAPGRLLDLRAPPAMPALPAWRSDPPRRVSSAPTPQLSVPWRD
jgi:hypothetical protein